ncbi:peptide ABC transporter substrate-binding protein [Lujinxingia litoralis]|uniref:Peptide ABC transporter substrate-binding protein n=1 Tax=Lujinxingia litoralis TaxID=2211119 RepID=A0A328CB56_9DELT|nr:peptide ABC transporter substrate-binding protein [Lujinxingia litoralis]RAL23709.1 peptide ABC transporter substrate-binding protein [Lujinxingia litoralis]
MVMSSGNTMARRVLMGALAGAMTLSIWGCDKEPAPSGKGQAKGGQAAEFVAGSKADMFTFAVAADPQTLDPGRMSGAPEGRVAFNLFEGLMMPGPTTEGLKEASELVVPGVAESYELSEDGRTYTFKLREDAKWSNGEPVTAEDFERSWRRVLTPDFPSDYQSFMWVIDNAEAYSKGEITDWSQVGVKVVDARTLEVTLAQPTPYFPELVAFYTFFPVPMDLIEEKGNAWTRAENIVSNGAYTLESYREQQDMLLKKNEHYWDKDNVALDQARIRIIQDTNAAVNAYRTGELHWSGTSLPVAQITGLLTHPDYLQEPMLGVYYYRINVSDEESPLVDNRVRQALAMAVDRQSLVEDTMNNLYTVANHFVPQGLPGYTEQGPGLSYNVQRAKELLAEAGYPDGEGFPRVQLLYNVDENHKLIAEAVQAMWKRNLGVDIQLVNKEWRTYLQDVSSMSYEIARAGWIGDYNDPMTFLDMWETGNGNNNTGWSDAEYDELLNKARAERDPAQRMAFLAQAEAIVLERGPVIPVYYYTNNILVSRFLEGFEPHNRDIHLIKYLSLPQEPAAPAE